MIYELKLKGGVEGSYFNNGALPPHLQNKPYMVISQNFEPDGGFYELNKDLEDGTHMKHVIPTGVLTWQLKFA